MAASLGPIAFSQLEIATGIRFGGRQRLAVHVLNGGGRVIEVLGHDDADIRFSGILAGPDAITRAHQIDEMRNAGFFLPLSWDVFFYTVVVREFAADYRNAHWIPFTLVCTVVRDETSVEASPVALTEALVAADCGEMESLASQAGLTLAIESSPAGVDPSLARSQLSSALNSLENSWNPGDLDTITSPAEGVSALGTALTSTRNLAMLSAAAGYAGRAVANAFSSERA